MSPHRKLDIKKVDKSVSIISVKMANRAATKAVRDFSKDFGTNQFDTALILLGQFRQLLNVFLNYVEIKDLRMEFLEFMKNLSPDFESVLNNYMEFSILFEKRTIPLFGPAEDPE